MYFNTLKMLNRFFYLLQNKILGIARKKTIESVW